MFIDINGRVVQSSITQVKRFIRNSLTDCLYLAVKPRSSQTFDYMNVPLAEVFPIKNPRSSPPEFMAAKKKEIESFIERGMWKIVLKKVVPPNSNVLKENSAPFIKNKESDTVLYKALFGDQRHGDKEKNVLIQERCTVKQGATRLLLAVALDFFSIWSHDVRQTYSK